MKNNINSWLIVLLIVSWAYIAYLQTIFLNIASSREIENERQVRIVMNGEDVSLGEIEDSSELEGNRQVRIIMNGEEVDQDEIEGISELEGNRQVRIIMNGDEISQDEIERIFDDGNILENVDQLIE